jgi:hypothetical protein
MWVGRDLRQDSFETDVESVGGVQGRHVEGA